MHPVFEVFQRTAKLATKMVIKHGAGHPFANYSLIFAGTGFVYDGNMPIEGEVTSLIIRNAANQTVLTINGITAGTIASDLSDLAFLVLGVLDPNSNFVGRDGKAAWSLLMSGNDVINGTSGDDRRGLVGFDAGNDTYNLGDGDDQVNGGIGNDTYNGGNGFDTLTFRETTFNEGSPATRGISVDMNTGVVLDCWGGTDTINSIEEIQGSRFKDTFTGGAGDDEFLGLAGRDVINGGAGNNDKVKYQDEVWQGGNRGIVANLTAGTIRDGFGHVDSVSGIEWVIGTRFNDSFVGSAGRDVFIGDFGVDTYNGMSNPNDSGEVDRIQFDWTFSDQPQTGISVDLLLASGQIINDGYGNTESCTSIEGIIGSNQNDTIKGNHGINLFAGADGTDVMSGRGGINEYVWWDLNHFGDGDIITDFVAAKDKLSFDMNNIPGMNSPLIIENDLTPDTAGATFLFDNATDLLYWDANGSGAGQRYEIVKLTGVTALSAANFELY